MASTPAPRGGRPPLSPALLTPTYVAMPKQAGGAVNGGELDMYSEDLLAGEGEGGGEDGEGGGSSRGDGGSCRACERLPTWARFALLALVVAAVVGAFVGLLFGGGGGAPQPQPARTLPVAVNTWFIGATREAFALLANGSSALDAAELGCQSCEDARCDGTVGWGGSPDSTGETTLDALIMDGVSMDVGAVGDLRRVKHAIATARKVLHYTSHTLLVGEAATDFALMMGLPEEDLHSQESEWAYGNWSQRDLCQPNFFLNVEGQNSSCPPYVPIPTPSYSPVAAARAGQRAATAPPNSGAATAVARPAPLPAPLPARRRERPVPASRFDHDTIGMCTLDLAGNIAAGVSSNGANHKVAGRVGDAPIVGAGGYASNDAGCAAATGDGDITMRFLPAYQAVENMRRGMSPADACADAVRRIERAYPKFELGLVCLSSSGDVGAASHGWTFTYCAERAGDADAQCVRVPPMDGDAREGRSLI